MISFCAAQLDTIAASDPMPRKIVVNITKFRQIPQFSTTLLGIPIRILKFRLTTFVVVIPCK
jgi:hypothetical protein